MLPFSANSRLPTLGHASGLSLWHSDATKDIRCALSRKLGDSYRNRTLGSLATLGILKLAMVDILAAFANLGLLAEKAVRLTPDCNVDDKTRSCRDAMLNI